MAWMTRKQVRSQPVQSYSERQQQKLLDAYDRAMGRLNDQYLRAMGEHIRDIGTMWPSDVHRLQQIRRMNKNLRQLQRRIGVAAGRTESEIGRIFQKIAEEDVRMQQKILGVPDILRIENNKPLQRILQAQARETAERMRNLSNTTVVSKYYRDAVDEAVTAVQSGVEDYNTAIRRVIREAGEHGMRVTEEGTRKVDYESGWSRRLDTAARMNVLDGVRHLNQSIMEEVSRQFGANGVEIDAHMLCAEDHLPYQGGQYSNEEFEEIQDSLDRPFGEWKCRHSWHGIILGVSPPTYTPDQLDQMQRYSTEMITIDGRTKTRYQWSQEMRRMETAVRQQKDTANLARATGDDKLRLRCQGTILQLNQKYEALANKAGLQPEFQRTYVAGFKDAKYTEVLTDKANGGTMYLEDKETVNPRNKDPLDAKQISDAIDFAVLLGMPRELIEYRDNWHTSYWFSQAIDGPVEYLRLGPDLYPATDGKRANDLITWKGALGHELIGHRETCLKGTNGPPLSAFDEAQASIRASRFTPELTDHERQLLLQDAKDRLKKAGLDYDTEIKKMDLGGRM